MRRVPSLHLDVVLADALRTGAGDGRAGASPDPATDAILDATSALLGEQGLRHWTMEDVATRSGTGRATVYRRFPGRDELVRAAVSRDARRYFAAIAGSVRATDPLPDQVVDGFVTGLRLARHSPLGILLRRDPAAAVALLASETLMQAASGALAERYELHLDHQSGPRDRARVAAVAEALIRLGLSFLLVPGPTADMADERAARHHLDRIIRPLLDPRRPPRR